MKVVYLHENLFFFLFLRNAMRQRGGNRSSGVWVPALVQRNMQQRYMELQEIELSEEEDGNDGEVVCR